MILTEPKSTFIGYWKKSLMLLGLSFLILSFNVQCKEKETVKAQVENEVEANTQAESEIETNESNKPISYLALGDSYTIGQSVSVDQRWPNQLVQKLNNDEDRVTEAKIIAQTGWRTDNMLDAAEAEINADKFDLVSLLIGVNNEFQGRSVESFETDFKECLDYAIDHCNNGIAGVFVLSIPDYGYTSYGEDNMAEISPRIDAYNAVCQAECELQGVAYYEITEISRDGLENEALVAEDGLHPSAIQYQLWVDACCDRVTVILNNLN